MSVTTVLKKAPRTQQYLTLFALSHAINALLIVCLCIALLALNSGAMAADLQQGRVLSSACVACHATDGNSISPMWPKLAGQHAAYLSAQLHDFKSGKRKNIQMSALVAALSDDDIEDLAAYYASQQVKIGVTPIDRIELGERLYRAGSSKHGIPACVACHGPKGEGNPMAGYPMLSGQHAEYTMTQLKAFKVEQRDNDRNSMMRLIAGAMNNEQIEAISYYLQGLH